jgi:ferritin-like metal-binding protein YciE
MGNTAIMSDIGNSNTSIRYETAAPDQTTGDERHSLQAYVSDLLALEQHIGQALNGQLASESIARRPAARSVVAAIKAQNEAHVTALRDDLRRLGGHSTSGIKSAWASLLGEAAKAVGAGRKTKVTRWLRDDYTALNLGAMSYTLLHATAIGLGDAATAQVARAGLADYARSVMQINDVIPEIVLNELADDGDSVATGAADTVRQQTRDIWKSQSAVTNH